MQNTDPIMTPREFLTLPKNQADVFLNLWVERQPYPNSAAAQAQGLRLKAALAVASGTEQNHPLDDWEEKYREDEEIEDNIEAWRQEAAERDGYDECCNEPICECDHGQYGPPPPEGWEDQVDPSGRTFAQAWKEFGVGIERENERTAALNAASKTDSLSPKQEGAAV